MDIAKLIPTERVVEILHPKTGKEIGLTVTVVSLEDEKLKAIKRKFLDAKARAESRGKTLKIEETEEFDTMMIFTAMTGWAWGENASYNGQKLDFNLKNVREVITNVYWIRQQLLEAITDGDSFLPD